MPALPSFSFLVGNDLAYHHEDLAGITQIEFLREVAEELAVDTRPNKTAIGINMTLVTPSCEARLNSSSLTPLAPSGCRRLR